MRKLLFSLGILLISFSFYPSFAQKPSIRTQKIVSRNQATYEPDLYVGSRGSFSPKVHMRANNGNTIVAGNSTFYPGAFLSGLNEKDYMLWAKLYHSINYNGNIYYDTQLQSLQPGIDSGYIMMGLFRQATAATDYAWVVRLGNRGDSVWQRFYGGTGTDIGTYVCRVKDKGYIFIGSSTSLDGTLASARNPSDSSTLGRVWVCRIDEGGNLLWTRCFGYPSSTDGGVIIKCTSDGGFICGANMQSKGYASSSYHGGTDIWLAKLDSTGNIDWARYYGGSGNDFIGDVEETADGGFVFVGGTSSNDGDVSGFHGTTDAWVVKVTNNGQITWQRSIGGTANDYLADIIQTQDGGFVAIGSTTSSDGDVISQFASDNILLTKLSNPGTLLWTKVFGGNSWDYGRNVLQTGENEFLINAAVWSEDGDIQGNVRWEPSEPPGVNWIAHLGSSSTIKGTAYFDGNNNGVKDGNERSVDNVIVTASKENDYQRSNLVKNGFFAIEVDTGSYSTALNFKLPYYNIEPVAAVSTFASYFKTDSIGFRLIPIPNKQDLAINLIPVTPARPGFMATYRVFYQNMGTTLIPSGDIVLKKDSRTTLFSAQPAVSNINGNILTWNYTDLNPGDTASIFLQLQIAAPPVANNGDTLSFQAVIDPMQGDETPANDTASLRQRVFGSYDPNNKSESNAGSIPLTFVTSGNYLQYTIRFQNTGTDTAFNIVVMDTLSNRLDASTLEMVTASHPYSLTINGNDNLAWRFDNILLPDSNRNEPASHGYIVYRIRPKSDLAKGEIVHNTAAIYFDFNLPVVTNDATTQVQSTLVVLPQGLLHFYGSQLDNQVKIFWQITEGTDLRYFEIERSEDGRTFNAIGTVVAIQSGTDYRFTDIQSPNAIVYYRLKLVQANGNFRYSPVLLFQNRTENATSIVVYPNPLRTQGFTAFYSNADGKAELQVLTAGGMLISREQVVLAKGKNVFAISKTPVMPPGQYILRVVNGGQVNSQTFIAQ